MHENGRSRFRPKLLCLTIPKKFVVTTSKFQIIWDLENFLSYQDFPSKFYSYIPEKLREESSSVSESFKREVSKKLSIRTEYHDFPSKNFLLRVPKDFRCGKLRCIGKVRLSKKFMPKRVISLFSVDFFSRILRIKFVTESLFVSESMGHQKFLCSEGAALFSVGLFWPSSTYNFRE